MKCKICGGELQFIEGKFICENCKNELIIDESYKDADVFIACINSDQRGGKTLDAVIAKDIYNSLNAKKIKTFWGVESASNIIGDEYTMIEQVAYENVKVIVVIGTNADNFSLLMKKYQLGSTTKRIIPIVKNVKPDVVPKEISKIQAMDYDKVGAVNDLVNATLNILGREKETNYEALRVKSNKKTIAGLIIAFVMVAIICVIVFFLVTKKPEEDLLFKNEVDSISKDEVDEEELEKEYQNAVALFNDGKNAQAINEFSKIIEYKDSKKKISILYNKYSGSFVNESGNINITLKVHDAVKCDIELVLMKDNMSVCRISEVSAFTGDEIDFNYTDSEGNEGIFKLKLLDNGINVILSETNNKSDVSFGSVEVEFDLNSTVDTSKVDINKEQIISYLSKKTFVSALNADGLEAEYIMPLTGMHLDELKPFYSDAEGVYRIKNTGIYISLYKYDVSDGSILEYIYEENPVIVDINAPASLVATEKIGKEKKVFLENDILFVPYAYPVDYDGSEYGCAQRGFISMSHYAPFDSNELVTEETMYNMTSRSILGDELFDKLLVEVGLNEVEENKDDNSNKEENLTTKNTEIKDDIYFVCDSSSAKIKNGFITVKGDIEGGEYSYSGKYELRISDRAEFMLNEEGCSLSAIERELSNKTIESLIIYVSGGEVVGIEAESFDDYGDEADSNYDESNSDIKAPTLEMCLMYNDVASMAQKLGFTKGISYELYENSLYLTVYADDYSLNDTDKNNIRNSKSQLDAGLKNDFSPYISSWHRGYGINEKISITLLIVGNSAGEVYYTGSYTE